MSAGHQCPGCSKSFSYLPSDYHQKIGCGNEGCSRIFGFLQHPVSARRWAEVRKELAAAQEERVLKAEARARRAARGAARAPTAPPTSTFTSTSSAKSQEQLFLLELIDACPRCGRTLDCEAEPNATPQAHLAQCTDAALHAAHAAALASCAGRAAAASVAAQAAGNAQALAAWVAGGRVLGGLWMLPQGALEELCRGVGLPVGVGGGAAAGQGWP